MNDFDAVLETHMNEKYGGNEDLCQNCGKDFDGDFCLCRKCDILLNADKIVPKKEWYFNQLV